MPLRARASGRVCLLGEHSDWHCASSSSSTIGACLVVPTREQLVCECEHADDDARTAYAFAMTTRERDGRERAFACDLRDRHSLVLEARKGEYWSYVAGAIVEIVDRYGKTIDFSRGARARCDASALPAKRGLSSSAAACVCVIRVFASLYEIDMSAEEEMAMAYRAEAVWTPSACGKMDQACAFAAGEVISMTFASNGDVSVRSVKCGKEITILVGDLGKGKDTVKILESLQKAAAAGHEGLRHAFGETNLALVARATDAIERGDARALGEVYTEAQEVFDAVGREVCPSELEAPALHEVLADAKCRELSFGGKGVGSQGDGCVQFVCASSASADELQEYLQSNYPSMGMFLRVTLGSS